MGLHKHVINMEGMNTVRNVEQNLIEIKRRGMVNDKGIS